MGNLADLILVVHLSPLCAVFLFCFLCESCDIPFRWFTPDVGISPSKKTRNAEFLPPSIFSPFPTTLAPDTDTLPTTVPYISALPEIRGDLWKQFHVCDCHLIRHIFIPILHRLGRTPQIFFKAFLLTAKACQGQPRRQYYRTAALYPPLPQFFCDGCKCQQVVTATRRFIPLQRLPSCPAHIPAPLVFQHILPGVGLMLICRDPRGKHTMPCFHGIVAMVNAKDLLFDFSLSFLSLWKTPFSFPQPVIYPGWGYGGGVKRSTPRFPGASVSNLCLQKGTLPPGHGTCKKIAPAVAGACSIYMIVSLCTWETEKPIIESRIYYVYSITQNPTLFHCKAPGLLV